MITNVLQQAIKNVALTAALKHPFLDDPPCPVLQHADDTLIAIQGDVEQAKILKNILDDSEE
jgi:hypothetical protein